MAYAFTLEASKFLSMSSDIIDYNANYTIAFWIYYNQLTTFDSHVGISDGTSNNRDILLLNTTGGGVLIATRVNVGGAQTTTAGTNNLSTATWYFVALVRDGAASLKVYVNGTLELTNTRNTAGRAASSVAHFGIDQGGGNPIDARLVHMKAWTRALTVQELISESKTIRVLNPVSIYGWWPMLKNAQRNVDYSGKGHTWTENGSIADAENPPIGWGAPNPMPIYIPAPVGGVNIPVMMHQRMMQGMS